MPRKMKEPARVGYPYTCTEVYVDPMEEWLADNSEEWSYKYPGKYLAIVDYEVLGIHGDFGQAFDQGRAERPDGELTVWYVPREDELLTAL